ncbi:Rrf2 family transcriptional regulator [Fibrisoma montanum]|uniref:Rrf2 family transcriptional regulator n=1 Tax=Fibrisoma montanum TaxID=2305895 RepID=A0A418M3B0_9BACT|nr:Rrf2 family transcriptional regulator [Fibrisoma montanum]RIV20029.1 Rrf2 family transcriptional regulator [Fibrisoma montanum]
MISKKAKYALKAMTRLAEQYGRGPVLTHQLAKEGGIPKRFLESILFDLRNHGLLQSRKGKDGGYQLRIEPDKITLAQILRIIDGPIAPTPCVSKNFYVRCDDCEDEQTCHIRPIMERVRDANLAIYETTTLAGIRTCQTGNEADPRL